MRVERNKSGRGRGRGRSSTRNFGNKKKSSTTLSSDKKQYKFATQQSGTNAQQYQIYDKVMEKLKAYVAKSFGEYSLDILNCIEGESYDSFENDEPIEQVFEAPVLPRLIPNDAEGNETKRMEYDFKSKEYILLVESSKREYHTKSERYDKRQRFFEANKLKLYNTIMEEYCSSNMKDTILRQSDYEDKLKNDPIELLLRLKLLVHDPVRARYEYASATDALKRFVNIKQAEGEGISDYLARFKQARDVVVAHMGSTLMDDLAKKTKEYRAIDTTLERVKQEEQQKEIVGKAFTVWTAYLFTDSVDPRKYGSLTRNWSEQIAQKVDKYPKTLTEAMDAFGQHQFDFVREKRMVAAAIKSRSDDKKNGNNKSNNDDDSKSSTPQAASFAQQRRPW